MYKVDTLPGSIGTQLPKLLRRLWVFCFQNGTFVEYNVLLACPSAKDFGICRPNKRRGAALGTYVYPYITTFPSLFLVWTKVLQIWLALATPPMAPDDPPHSLELCFSGMHKDSISGTALTKRDCENVNVVGNGTRQANLYKMRVHLNLWIYVEHMVQTRGYTDRI
jgi:hypothetical protein